MFKILIEMSWLGVFLATVFNFIFGGVYFGIAVSKIYSRAMGREGELRQKPTSLMIAGPAVCGLFINLTSGLLIRGLDIQTLSGALEFGAIVGIGYAIPMTMTIAINPNFPRPFLYTAINAPYFLASSLATSMIFLFVS